MSREKVILRPNELVRIKKRKFGGWEYVDARVRGISADGWKLLIQFEGTEEFGDIPHEDVFRLPEAISSENGLGGQK